MQPSKSYVQQLYTDLGFSFHRTHESQQNVPEATLLHAAREYVEKLRKELSGVDPSCVVAMDQIGIWDTGGTRGTISLRGG